MDSDRWNVAGNGFVETTDRSASIVEQLDARLGNLQTLALLLPEPPKAKYPKRGERDRAAYDSYAIQTIAWQAGVIHSLSAPMDENNENMEETKQ